MPYFQSWNLPKSVKENLPEEAQTIFTRAHNLALREFNNEITANRVGWQAVEDAGYLDREEWY